MTVVLLAFSAPSGTLAARIGPRLQMSVGPPAVGVFGFGLAITVAPLTAAVLAAAPAEHVGLASAVNNDVARVAGLIAVAVLPPLAGITGTNYRHASQLAHG